ncbi:MAG: hypothetical protein CL676_00205 [Bdellovibrionaceae bacterium]|nr:hypothetical protein [Pseudobdellovibrionaceae bacterium]|tara:strand:- start:786 stop:1496 length:711 start_codon:yes stop_codon:yes gene_type:complete
MSGGIDSEIVALSFLAAKIKFKAVSIRFNDGLNRHDIQFAVDFTRKHKISHEIFDLNIVDFFASDEFLRLAHNSQCVTPQFPSLMKVMKIASLSNGYPVIGSGDCYLKKENNDWVLYEREKVASIYKFLIANRIQGCAGFFQYTPEIILAYLRDPIVEKLLQNQIPYKPSNYDLKSEIYSNYFEFESRPKFTGYEYLQNLDQKYRSTLKAKLPFCDEIFKTSHLSLAQQLSPRGSI